MKFKLVERLNHDTWIYHGTNHISDILQSDKLQLGRQYSAGRAVCFSRDFNFVKRFPYILVVDKNRLHTRYKVIPISDSKNAGYKQSRYIKTPSKAEEVVLTDIIDLHKYIDYIVTDEQLPLNVEIPVVTKKTFESTIL